MIYTAFAAGPFRSSAADPVRSTAMAAKFSWGKAKNAADIVALIFFADTKSFAKVGSGKRR
jgi:hypothetical protein